MAAHFSYTLTVQLEYTNHLLQFFKLFPYYDSLCFMLSVTYYAQNYAGIIDWSLVSSFLTEMCSDHAPSFIQNVHKQGRGQYVFRNHFTVLIHGDSFAMYVYCCLIVCK